MPEDNPPTIQQALQHLTSGHLPDAIATAQKAVEESPQNPDSHYHLAFIYTVAGMRPEAIDQYRQALALQPGIKDANLKLGQILLTQGRREEAIQHFQQALQDHPDQIEAHASWAEALIELGKPEEAEEHLQPQPTAGPEQAVAHGIRLQTLGRFDQAKQQFQHALALAPRQGAPYYFIARAQKFTPAHQPEIDQMTQLARDPRLPMPDKITLQYALGKAKEDLKEYRQAMNHYDEANGLAAIYRNVHLDKKGLTDYNDWRIRAFQPEPIQHFKPYANPSEKPLFVVGMIRSGTTLVEQMLSNHPEIGGGGEMLYWNEKQEALNSRIAQGVITGEFIQETAREYLQLLDQLCPNTPRAIDKMPLNYFMVGGIHLTLPNVRFIHVRRSPADTCFSIYTTFFESSPNFAHDQDNIAFYYREYHRLMAHWRQLLPPDRFLDVDYEALTTNPEATMRQIVAFCDLEWNEACLHPESNPRPVRTPSAWQVRQPTYQSSQNRRSPFNPWIPAFEKLEQDLD